MKSRKGCKIPVATTSSFASFSASAGYLDSLYREPLVPAHRVGLRRAAILLQHLGNPHRGFRSVHIAGSTGKGSTTSMLGSILSTAGHRTGIFRSPHLTTYRERVAVDDVDISEESWLWTFSLVHPVVEAMRLNTLPGFSLGRPALFEVLFAMACLHFAREGVTWAAVETGLGGRLDATNLLQSDVAAITNVSLEHTQILGTTVSEIAREKAAIIKRGTVGVTGVSAPEALSVIERRARHVEAPLMVVGRDVNVTIVGSDVWSQHIVLSGAGNRVSAKVPLAGRHQAHNAAVAFGAALALGQHGLAIPGDVIREGLERVRVPGRLEIFSGEPQVIVDGAHNPAGMQALADALANLPPASTTLLFAAMDDKDIETMAEFIVPHIHRVIVTSVPGSSRTGNPVRLVRAFAALGRQVSRVDDEREALCQAREATPAHGRLVVAGSMYLVGAIRPFLAGPAK